MPSEDERLLSVPVGIERSTPDARGNQQSFSHCRPKGILLVRSEAPAHHHFDKIRTFFWGEEEESKVGQPSEYYGVPPSTKLEQKRERKHHHDVQRSSSGSRSATRNGMRKREAQQESSEGTPRSEAQENAEMLRICTIELRRHCAVESWPGEGGVTPKAWGERRGGQPRDATFRRRGRGSLDLPPLGV